MKKSFIISVLLSIMYILTGCTSTSTAIPPTFSPTPAINADPIQTKKTAAEYYEEIYIGNKNSKKLHKPDCQTLPLEKNRVKFKNRAYAINAGYSPCENCQP